MVSNVLLPQGDNKKMEDAKFYLTLPGTKLEMEEKELQAAKNQVAFTPSKDSTKDSFQIATLICSTKLTQNGRCRVTGTQRSFLLGLMGLGHVGQVFRGGCCAAGFHCPLLPTF